MRFGDRSIYAASLFLAASLVCLRFLPAGEMQLPSFGRDTVLVWKIENVDFSADFVVRIAEFLPDRYLEWEDEKTQGTIFMPDRDVRKAQGFVGTQLFESGIDSRGRNVTTLWLSQKIFQDLKEKRKIKFPLDGIAGQMTFEGTDQMTIEVNRSSRALPVIKTKDDRGSERWFLDNPENPLLAKHTIRQFSQTLVSITTDRQNTLRWIKGRKLANPPH
jgi:hypothetical protein